MATHAEEPHVPISASQEPEQPAATNPPGHHATFADEIHRLIELPPLDPPARSTSSAHRKNDDENSNDNDGPHRPAGVLESHVFVGPPPPGSEEMDLLRSAKKRAGGSILGAMRSQLLERGQSDGVRAMLSTGSLASARSSDDRLEDHVDDQAGLSSTALPSTASGMFRLASRLKTWERAAVADRQLRDQGSIRDVLCKPLKRRSHRDISFLMRMLSDNAFFENLGDQELVRKLCAVITYEKIEDSTCVFLQGELGKKFYIILSGHVSLHQKMTHEQLNEDRVLASRAQTAGAAGGRGPRLLKRDVEKRAAAESAHAAAIAAAMAVGTTPGADAGSDGDGDDPGDRGHHGHHGARRHRRRSEGSDDEAGSGWKTHVTDPYGATISLAEHLFLNEMFAGDAFGELSLATGELRAATVVARAPTELLVIGKEDYDDILKAHHTKQITDLRTFAQGIAPLRHLAADGRNFINIATFFKRAKFSHNSVIVREGDRAAGLIFIRSGACVVSRQCTVARTWLRGALPHKTFENHSVDLATLTPGEYFGDVPLLLKRANRTHPYTVIASGEVQCYTMSDAEFTRSVRGRSYAKFLEMANARHDHLQERFTQLCTGIGALGAAAQFRPSVYDTVRHHSEQSLAGGPSAASPSALGAKQAGDISSIRAFKFTGGASLPLLSPRFSRLVRGDAGAGAAARGDTQDGSVVVTAAQDISVDAAAAGTPGAKTPRAKGRGQDERGGKGKDERPDGAADVVIDVRPEDAEILWEPPPVTRLKLKVHREFASLPASPAALSRTGRKIQRGTVNAERSAFALEVVLDGALDGIERAIPVAAPRTPRIVSFGLTTEVSESEKRTRFVNTLNMDLYRRRTDTLDHNTAEETRQLKLEAERRARLQKAWKKKETHAKKFDFIEKFDMKSFLPPSIQKGLLFQNFVPQSRISKRDWNAVRVSQQSSTVQGLDDD